MAYSKHITTPLSSPHTRVLLLLLLWQAAEVDAWQLLCFRCRCPVVVDVDVVVVLSYFLSAHETKSSSSRDSRAHDRRVTIFEAARLRFVTLRPPSSFCARVQQQHSTASQPSPNTTHTGTTATSNAKHQRGGNIVYVYVPGIWLSRQAVHSFLCWY